jgi:hypothetical protein
MPRIGLIHELETYLTDFLNRVIPGGITKIRGQNAKIAFNARRIYHAGVKRVVALKAESRSSKLPNHSRY